MYNNLGFCILSVALVVVVVSAQARQPIYSTSPVTSLPENGTPAPTASTESKNSSQRQIEEASSPDFVDEMLNLFVQFINFDKAAPSITEESKVVENAAEGRGIRLKKFLLPFLLGVSVKTKALILAAIGFLLVITKITFIKSKIALVIGVGLLLYHLYVKKAAIHHIKHALHSPVHYDVSPAWSAPLGTWAYPDWGAAAAATGQLGQLGTPYILRKTSQEHPSVRFR